MPKYRKKPVVIEAFQMTQKRRWDNSEWPNWLHLAWNKESGEGAMWCINGGEQLFIGTLEGVYEITWNDWIIQGVKGELYTCKDDIFQMTYEEVNNMPKRNEVGKRETCPEYVSLIRQTVEKGFSDEVLMNAIRTYVFPQARREGAMSTASYLYKLSGDMFDWDKAIEWINREYPVFPDAEHPKGEG